MKQRTPTNSSPLCSPDSNPRHTPKSNFEYYAVFNGKDGNVVYDNWLDASYAISGQTKTIHKGYHSYQGAVDALRRISLKSVKEKDEVEIRENKNKIRRRIAEIGSMLDKLEDKRRDLNEELLSLINSV